MKNKKQIILNCEELETRFALLRNGRLEEYEIERRDEDELVAGSIYLGRITHLEKKLEAAFVDIGAVKNGFLHYKDMLPASYDMLDDIRHAEAESGEQPAAKRRKKTSVLSKVADRIRGLVGHTNKAQRLKEFETKLHSGKITVADIPKMFPENSELLVQIVKGPIGTKGARLSTNITIPGRYLVLLPYSDHIGLSSRIDDRKERDRLRKILAKLDVPEGMGLICRTIGEGHKAADFEKDLGMLLRIWESASAALEEKNAPAIVYREPNLLERTVRDFLTDDIDEIVVDDPEAAKKLKADFAEFGCYKDQPENILRTNLEAAEEIARQVRLRNVGGLVVIDFIDMRTQRDRDAVQRAMATYVQPDRAKTRLLPISKFGLMEMTRQREHESVKDAVYDPCPYCNGSGRVKSPVSMSVEIQRRLKELLKRRTRKMSVRVIMHPTILERLKNDDAELLSELEEKYGKELSFRADPTMHMEQFRLVNPETNQEY